MFGDQALERIIKDSTIKTLVDLGAGSCEHANKFARAGKKVTAVDYKDPPENMDSRIKHVKSSFEDFYPDTPYDCVWSCHALEHQLNVGNFLSLLNYLTKEGGTLAITVPPAKNAIVSGHVTIWNAGLLLYNLVLAGFDCSHVSIKSYGYNISLVVKKRTIPPEIYRDLTYNEGDIERLSKYLPKEYNHQGFNGDIKELNW